MTFSTDAKHGLDDKHSHSRLAREGLSCMLSGFTILMLSAGGLAAILSKLRSRSENLLEISDVKDNSGSFDPYCGKELSKLNSESDMIKRELPAVFRYKMQLFYPVIFSAVLMVLRGIYAIRARDSVLDSMTSYDRLHNEEVKADSKEEDDKLRKVKTFTRMPGYLRTRMTELERAVADKEDGMGRRNN